MGLELRAADVAVRIEPSDGGRISSLKLRGQEVLGGVNRGTINHGSFVMAPWAGRIRFGRLAFDGTEHALPLRLPPHAAHGTVVDRPWNVIEAADSSVRMTCELSEPWPIPGRVTQDISVGPGRITQTVTVETTGDRFPASIGWHPWFRRRLDSGGPLRMTFDAVGLVTRDADGMPTSEHVDPGDGPWDDCFTGMRWPVRLEWPDALTLDITADTEFAVLYNLRDAVWCVEPQTGPPDELNASPRWVTAGDPLRATTTWSVA